MLQVVKGTAAPAAFRRAGEFRAGEGAFLPVVLVGVDDRGLEPVLSAGVLRAQVLGCEVVPGEAVEGRPVVDIDLLDEEGALLCLTCGADDERALFDGAQAAWQALALRIGTMQDQLARLRDCAVLHGYGARWPEQEKSMVYTGEFDDPEQVRHVAIVAAVGDLADLGCTNNETNGTGAR